jgi:hypothetical protein
MSRSAYAREDFDRDYEEALQDPHSLPYLQHPVAYSGEDVVGRTLPVNRMKRARNQGATTKSTVPGPLLRHGEADASADAVGDEDTVLPLFPQVVRSLESQVLLCTVAQPLERELAEFKAQYFHKVHMTHSSGSPLIDLTVLPDELILVLTPPLSDRHKLGVLGLTDALYGDPYNSHDFQTRAADHLDGNQG